MATWSFLLRAVWSLPATGPISSVKRASKFMWMSSFSTVNVSSPASSWSWSFLSPVMIWSASAAGRILVSFNIVTWAKEPSKSSAAICWSKEIEAPNSSTHLAPVASKRPPHILLTAINSLPLGVVLDR